MEEPPPLDWVGRIIATATSVWQAFVVPSFLGLWAVYQFRAKRTDTKGATEQVRETLFMDRLQARIATQDAENVVLRKELSEERNSGLRWMRLAQGWHGMARDLVHERKTLRSALNVALELAGKPAQVWPPDDVPELENLSDG